MLFVNVLANLPSVPRIVDWFAAHVITDGNPIALACHFDIQASMRRTTGSGSKKYARHYLESHSGYGLVPAETGMAAAL